MVLVELITFIANCCTFNLVNHTPRIQSTIFVELLNEYLDIYLPHNTRALQHTNHSDAKPGRETHARSRDVDLITYAQRKLPFMPNASR